MMIKSFLPINTYNKFTKHYCNIPNMCCGYCGHKYSELNWPRTCKCCSNISFRNPIPVAVGILPFELENGNHSILLVERAIKPFIGGFCLPGGFIDWNESWKEAISREVFEETTVITDPNEFSLQTIHSTPDNTRILIFGKSNKIRNIKELTTFKPSQETSKLLLGDISTKLCFSLHQEVYDNIFFSKE